MKLSQVLKKFFKILNYLNIKIYKPIFFFIVLGVLDFVSILSIGLAAKGLKDFNSVKSEISPYLFSIDLSFLNIQIFFVLIFIIFLLRSALHLFIIHKNTKFMQSCVVKIKSFALSAYLLSSVNNKLFTEFKNVINFLIIRPDDIGKLLTKTLQLSRDFLVFVSVILLLSIVNFKLLLFSLIIFLFSAIIYFTIIKKKLSFFSNELNDLKLKKLRTINSIFLVFKEIKFKDSLLNFKKRSFDSDNKTAKVATTINTLNMFPQVIIEVIIIFLVCLLILIQSYTSDLNEQFFYSAAIFLMGAYRIKPFFVSLLEYATTVKLNENQVNGIYYLFEENKELIATQLHGIKNFEIENIHFRNINFSTKNREIFQNIDFQIEKGDKIFIYGESGSGKSTLLNLLLKFKKPKSGEILINGRNIDDFNYENFLHKINYLQQEPEIFEGTLLENISLRDSDKADLNKLNEVIELCNLTNFFKYNCKNNFNFNLKELGNNLSGGERQRITLARVIYEGRKLIILDEPVKSLDESNQIEITKNLIKKLKSSTLIFLSHNPILEKYFDKVYYIKNRKLIKKL